LDRSKNNEKEMTRLMLKIKKMVTTQKFEWEAYQEQIKNREAQLLN
jgi:hypothetical protein